MMGSTLRNRLERRNVDGFLRTVFSLGQSDAIFSVSAVRVNECMHPTAANTESAKFLASGARFRTNLRCARQPGEEERSPGAFLKYPSRASNHYLEPLRLRLAGRASRVQIAWQFPRPQSHAENRSFRSKARCRQDRPEHRRSGSCKRDQSPVEPWRDRPEKLLCTTSWFHPGRENQSRQCQGLHLDISRFQASFLISLYPLPETTTKPFAYRRRTCECAAAVFRAAHCGASCIDQWIRLETLSFPEIPS